MGEPLSAPRRDPLGVTGWRGDWAGLRVVVLGLGEVGFSAADTLVELGAEVVVVAGEATPERRELVAVIGAAHRERDGDAAAEAVAELAPDLVVVSPGYPAAHPAVARAREDGIPVWGDLELAWRLRDKRGARTDWLAVTGRGSRLVAELASAMLLAAGLRAAPAGGPGLPVLDAVRDPVGYDLLLVEAAPRQLRWLAAGAPLSPAPLASLALAAEGGGAAEEGGAEGGGAADGLPPAEREAARGLVYAGTRVACVYPVASPDIRSLVEEAEVQEGARAIGIGLGIPGPSELGIVEDLLVDRAFLEERRSHALELASLDDLAGAGLRSSEEVLAALAAAALARAAGAPPAAVRAGLLSRAS